MTAPATVPPTDFTVFLPFTKVSDLPDGTIRVHSVINDETVDDQGEILDYEGTKAALNDFMKWANVREMHQPSAVGIVESVTHDDLTKSSEGILHIVDPTAVAKTKADVYKGTSLGGSKGSTRLMQKVGGRNVTRLMGPIVTEVSLVDRPSRPTAVMTLLKRSEDDMGEVVIDVPGQDLAKAAEAVVETASAVAEPEADPKVIEGTGGAPDVYLEDGAVIDKTAATGDLAKRDISDSERSDIPAADFAGKGDSFPIQKPEDVAAAASSIGRAGPSNYSSDQLKSRIISIAKRKGAAFEAKLPQSWQDDKAEKVSGVGDLHKSAADDAAHAAMVLSCINDLIESEASEDGDETADLGFLRGAQAAMLSFLASESAEVGTPEDLAEADDLPMVMAYSSVTGDLAKRASVLRKVGARVNAADLGFLNQIHDLSVAAGSDRHASDNAPVGEPGEDAPAMPAMLHQAAEGEAISAVTLEQTDGFTDEALAKVATIMRETLGTFVTKDDLASMQEGLSEVREDLRKIAAQPVSGGPLRYATDPRRFGEMLLEGQAPADPEEALLAKVSQRYAVGSVEREALGKAAATIGIKDALERG